MPAWAPACAGFCVCGEEGCSVNPLAAVRKRLGMNRRDFALRLGVSYNTLHAAESGYPRQLSVGIRRGLAALGEDAERIAAEYDEWRRQQAAERGGAA